ncbi:TetR/AcrR family transcriptional regulator C-terminal domain-containing protein [Nonomuraea longispora]|uniref:TetR/AcrR family transcriptional regulator C-terminal domain-containing protein n=1 Tax=Nonomuraea longispora TaxID=1848320 RepID=UPI001C6FD736|nr:TetR/AcrR family transcriptional regulator C-terminal domain-containing protein [Nonomuraea longispora]
MASVLAGYALTDAALISTAGGGDPQFGDAAVEGADAYGEVLAGLLDPGTYPALSAAVRGGALRGGEGWADDGDFRFGLELLLDGVEALIARRASGGDVGGK